MGVSSNQGRKLEKEHSFVWFTQAQNSFIQVGTILHAILPAVIKTVKGLDDQIFSYS